MADQANDCVIVLDSDDDDDDDDIVVVDEHGHPSEHDVIFVRRDRRRTNRNQPFPDETSSSKLSESTVNQPKNHTTESGVKSICPLGDKLGSPERSSNPAVDKRKRTRKLEKLSTWNSDVKPLQSAFNISPLSPDVQVITDAKPTSWYKADLLSPASPGTSIDSTDVAGRTSPSPFLDNRGAAMWSPAIPDANNKNGSNIVGRNFPSPFSDLFSPASPDACTNNTDVDGKHCPSHYSDDIHSSASSSVSPGASVNSTDVAGRNSPGPFSDNVGSLFSPASLDSADLYGKHSPFHSSSVDSTLASPASPAKSMNSADSDVRGNFSSSHFSHSNDSSLSSPDVSKISSCVAWAYLPPLYSSVSVSSCDSVCGTEGANSPSPFSNDGFSLSPASADTSVDSADISVTCAKSTDDKKSVTNCSDGICTDGLSVLTKQSKGTRSENTPKTLHTRVASMQQTCTCNVTQGMCQTCIDNLNNADTNMNKKSFTSRQTESTIIISNTDSSKLRVGSTSFSSVSNTSRSLQYMTGCSQKQASSGSFHPTAVVKQKCTCDLMIGSCHSCLAKPNKTSTTTSVGTSPMLVSSVTRQHLSTSSSQSATTRPKTEASHSKRSFGNAVDSTSDSSVVLKKQRLAPSTSQPLPSTSRLSSLDTANNSNFCFGCGTLIMTGNLSQCLDNHCCCSQCLQQQAKTLLTRQSKGSLKCFYPGCESFYPLSQLRKTLPAMVIEIVEEKMEQESLENATKFMMGQMEQVSRNGGAVNSLNKQEKVETWTLPCDWEPMDINGDMRTVEMMPGSESYVNASIMFHNTMHAPRAEIVCIRRVQNPILWQFYSVKRRQMLQEIGSEALLEVYLFHGTSNSVVDAICKSNFDWRLCGTHGTVFGQGSYFARDAKYAHMYTDGGNATARQPQQNILLSLPSTHGVAQIQMSASFGSAFPSRIPAGISTGISTGGSAPVLSNTTSTGQQFRTRHTMFVARVLVGKYTIGYSALRKPPPVNPSDAYGKSYNSCVNDMIDPYIFVIFDNAQCYPEYIIEYTNLPRWAIMTS